MYDLYFLCNILHLPFDPSISFSLRLFCYSFVFSLCSLQCCSFQNQHLSHVMRLWYFSSSVNSFFHPVERDVWFLVAPFVYFLTSYVRTAKALVRLYGCAGLPEPLLVPYVISIIISWAGSFLAPTVTDSYLPFFWFTGSWLLPISLLCLFSLFFFLFFFLCFFNCLFFLFLRLWFPVTGEEVKRFFRGRHVHTLGQIIGKHCKGPVKRICVFEHSVITNFNCACPAIQRGQGSGFLSESSSWLTADAQARLNLRCSH